MAKSTAVSCQRRNEPLVAGRSAHVLARVACQLLLHARVPGRDLRVTMQVTQECYVEQWAHALPSLRAWAAAFKVQGLWCKVSMTKNARLDRTGMNQCAQVRVGNGTLTLRPLTGTHCVGGVHVL